MKKTILLSLAISLLFIICCAAYFVRLLNEEFANTVEALIYLVPPLIAVIAGIYAVSKYQITNITGKTLALFTIGFLSWFIAEVLWAILKNILLIDAFPSCADIFYLAAYFFIFAGLITYLKISYIAWNVKKVIIAVILFLFLGNIVGYYGVYEAYDTTASFLENFFSIVYGVADLFLVFILVIALIMATEYHTGKIFLTWLFILFGFIFMISADILFAVYYEEYEEWLAPYRYMDFLWMASYLCFGYALFRLGFVVQYFKEKTLPTLSPRGKKKPRPRGK
ncbi:MAG: hypothetical protein WC752_00485 [Patescibacteria group bacterium]